MCFMVREKKSSIATAYRENTCGGFNAFATDLFRQKENQEK